MAEAVPNQITEPPVPERAERFYFRHRQGDTSVDDLEGAEFPSLQEAAGEAVSSLREIIAAMLLTTDVMVWDGAIEIINESGQVLKTVTYIAAAGVPDM
jgi:hypothetical protein